MPPASGAEWTAGSVLLTAGLGSAWLRRPAAQAEDRVDGVPWARLLQRRRLNLQPAKQHPGRDKVRSTRFAAVCLHCLPETALPLPPLNYPSANPLQSKKI